MTKIIPITDGRAPVPAGNHAIDCHVGARIFWRRINLGLSREDLAARIGRYSADQVRLWEDGYNRVPAAMLYRLSIALAMPITGFFEGMADASVPDGSAEGRFSGHLRHGLVALVETQGSSRARGELNALVDATRVLLAATKGMDSPAVTISRGEVLDALSAMIEEGPENRFSGEPSGTPGQPS